MLLPSLRRANDGRRLGGRTNDDHRAGEEECGETKPRQPQSVSDPEIDAIAKRGALEQLHGCNCGNLTRKGSPSSPTRS